MPKPRSAALQKEINRLAAEIRLEHAKLEKAGKKDLLFIYKHLKKAAKGIKRSVKKAKPSPGKKKKPAAPPPRKQPPLRVAKKTPAKTQPPIDPQGQSLK